MGYPFRNLVFEGGGVKGIAYVGALELLEKMEILQDIKRVGGTSAGAIIALIVGLGYSSEEFREKLDDMNLKSFMDDDINGFPFEVQTLQITSCFLSLISMKFSMEFSE